MITSKVQRKILKNVVAAVEPGSEHSSAFNVFGGMIQKFQDHGLLPSVKVISMIHSSMFMVPNSWYKENLVGYVHETKESAERSLRGKFDFSSIQVLKGKASANHLLVEQLSDYLKPIKSGLLVVLSNNRIDLPYWILGSFSETAAFSASMPVLVIKPQSKDLEYSVKPRLTVAIDVNVKYAAKDIKWLVDLALPSGAQIDLIRVRPSPRGLLTSLRKQNDPEMDNQELEKIRSQLSAAGILTTVSSVKEKDTVAQTIVNFADKKKSWAIVTISTERKLVRKLLLGSTARRILSLSKRPFFSLRLE